MVISVETKIPEALMELIDDPAVTDIILRSEIGILSIDLTGLELIESQCAKAQGQ